MHTRSLPKGQHAVNESERGDSRTAAGEAFSEFVVHVFRLDGLLTAAGDALAAPVGQTSARWRVLAAVDPTPRTVAQIARAWGLARQSVQRVADVLERDRLVTYEDNPEHRRAKLLRLTPHGHSVLRELQAAQSEWANALGQQVGATELQTANQLLARILQVLAHQHALEEQSEAAGELSP